MRLGWLFATLLPTGCEPWQTVPLPPDSGTHAGVIVTPDALEFTTSVALEHSSTLSFEIKNETGHETTVFVNTTITGSLAFAVDQNGILDMHDGDERSIPVTYTPTSDKIDRANLQIQGLDLEGDVGVSLTGNGHAPVLSINQVNTPETPIGCSQTAELEVENPGHETLILADLDASALGEFSLDGPFPEAIAPGEKVPVSFGFHPYRSGDNPGLIRFSTNDPNFPENVQSIHGTGTAAPWTEDRFHFATGAGVEILLAMDGDTSEAWPTKLADGLDDLLTHLDELGVDYRIAALSTVDACPSELGGWVVPGDDRSTAIATLEDALFATPGPYSGQFLELTDLALDNAAPGGCLSGFLRSGRALSVIVASDTDEEGSTPWDQQLAAIQKKADGDIRFSGILPTGSCGNTPIYDEVVATTGGTADDLCGTYWSTYWPDLALATATIEGGPHDHALSRPAVPTTVEVRVDDKPWRDFTVDETGTDVTFTSEPPVGSDVLVRYVAAEDCPG